MADISEYWDRTTAADRFGVSTATLDKYMKQAEQDGYGLPEPVKMGKANFWHISDWQNIQRGRLKPAMEEAVKLGFVVMYEDHEDITKLAHEDGYNIGYRSGYEQGIAAEGRRIPNEPQPEPENLVFTEGAGLTQGTFQPLGKLGL